MYTVESSSTADLTEVVLYDCDDFTQKFYLDYLGLDQREGRIDVSEKPLTHLKLTPPPHNGVGKEWILGANRGHKCHPVCCRRRTPC